MKQIGLLRLTPEDIDRIVGRFEEAVKDGIPWAALNGAVCKICYDPSRIAINRSVLQGKTYASLSRECGIHPRVFFAHWNKHLLPFVDVDLPGSRVLGNLAKIEAARKFPSNRKAEDQYMWCIGQLMVVRQVLVNEIDAGNSKERRSNAEALRDYVALIVRIRETISQMRDKRGASRRKA